MIKKFVRKILCWIDFWFYAHYGKSLTKIKYFKEDVPNKYWGKCLLNNIEIVPYPLIFVRDPKTIEVTEQDIKWAEELLQKNDFFKEEEEG